MFYDHFLFTLSDQGFCFYDIIFEGKLDLVVDQDQQYKITLKIEGKADRTAKVYKFICPIFRLDKTSLHQELEKLSENRINGYSI